MTASKRLTATILSISLLTVMAGAAIAPALGVIRNRFDAYPEILVQFIVSIPALFIIITNLLFPAICRVAKTRTIALVGLAMYVVCGSGAFFVTDLWTLLVLRALLGVSVGLIMPLSTGLLSYYFPPEEQAKLMGLSAAMNQMGGVVATLLAGLLSDIDWNYAFLVYLLGAAAVVLVAANLPNEKLTGNRSGLSLKTLRKFHPEGIGMLLLMIIFFIYPTNFAITVGSTTSLSSTTITCMMVFLDLIAFAVGLFFGGMMKRFGRGLAYMAPLFFFAGFVTLAFWSNLAALVASSVLIGIANGVGVPYINTVASLKGGRGAATTVMPLLSSSLYLGQFLSPLIVTPLGRALFGAADTGAPYKIGAIVCIVFFIQVAATRRSKNTACES